MYTVEFEPDACVITSLDESDAFEDVEVIIADDNTVFMRQWNDANNQHEILYMSYQQLLDLFAAMKSPEGAFYARATKDYNSLR
jgi:hypothetical protein